MRDSKSREDLRVELRTLTFLHNDTVLGSDISKLVDWVIADRQRIVEPLVHFKKCKYAPEEIVFECNEALESIDATLKLALGD